jgi:hypothetical protein
MQKNKKERYEKLIEVMRSGQTGMSYCPGCGTLYRTFIYDGRSYTFQTRDCIPDCSFRGKEGNIFGDDLGELNYYHQI